MRIVYSRFQYVIPRRGKDNADLTVRAVIDVELNKLSFISAFSADSAVNLEAR